MGLGKTSSDDRRVNHGASNQWKCGTAVVAAASWAAPLSAQVVRSGDHLARPMHAGEPDGAAGPFELIVDGSTGGDREIHTTRSSRISPGDSNASGKSRRAPRPGKPRLAKARGPLY